MYIFKIDKSFKKVLFLTDPRVRYQYGRQFTNKETETWSNEITKSEDLRRFGVLTSQYRSTTSIYVIWLCFKADFYQIAAFSIDHGISSLLIFTSMMSFYHICLSTLIKVLVLKQSYISQGDLELTT